MHYTPLDSKIIVLGARDREEVNAEGKKLILIPLDGSRVFIQCLEKEKVLANHTLACPTQITGHVRLTNDTSQLITIKVIFAD